jgi:alkylation response protein AidB-like acyl-CoA dehydrogenase
MIANTAGGVSFDTDDETELILESLDDCANGLAEENPCMDLVHQARILRIVEDTDEIQLNTIAKSMGITD